MDRKSFLILVVSGLLFASWLWLVNRLYPPRPVPEGGADITPTNQPAGSGTTAPVAHTPVISAAAPATTWITPTGREELVSLENDYVRCTITSHGGGLKLFELKNYPEAVGCRNGKNTSTNNVASLNTKAPVPAFTHLGGEALSGDGLFTLTRTAGGVRAEKLLPSGLYLVKEFHLGSNYLLTVTVRHENRTNQAIQLPAHEWVIGTATPMDPRDDGTMLSVEWFDGKRYQSVNEQWFSNRPLGCGLFQPRLRTIYEAAQTNLLWAAAGNRFFTMITIPATNAPAPQLVARYVELPTPGEDERKADPKIIAKPFGFQTAFLYPGTILATNQIIERRFDVFAGPKEYRTLDRLGAKFGNDVDRVMGFGGFFGFFSKGLLLSMNVLYGLGLPYGLTIIAITIVVKLLFWPLTQVSTRSMKRMAALQPQMKAIQEKYKDDPKKMNQKVMEFMKENRVNPAAGCLPMLIQIPVFIGFYMMLRSAIELRGARFLWACDLSQADTIFVIPGLNFPFNPLPLIMGATQLWQMRLTPPSPGMDPVQQKIMQYMPLMFLFILYNFSSGLTLYWTVQNLLTIAQMKLTKATEAKATGAKTPAAGRPGAAAPAKKKNK